MAEPATTPTNVRLGDLIEAIARVHQDPLDQLADAAAASEHLGEVADALVGHFVDRARRSGASWTAIGSSIGVSKQAAQKRYVGGVPAAPENADGNPFARFTPRARHAVVAAHELAVREAGSFVTSARLARGVLAERESLGVVTLQALGVDVDALASALAAFDDGDASPTIAAARAMVPYSDTAKAVLEETVHRALALGHNYVGTEHLLLALFVDPVVGPVLEAADVDADGFRRAVLDQLGQLPG
jgi:hypothetical protein